MRDQRLQAMEAFIFQQRHTSLQQLCDQFEISINTARRDVEVLLKWGAVNKVYGGVVANPRYRSYLHYGERSTTHTEEKRIIGELVASMLDPDEIIMADTGSTISEFFRHVDGDVPATIITNNLTAFGLFTQHPAIRLIGLGGEYLTSANGFAGTETVESLRRMKATKTFLSVTGIQADDLGITNAPSVENEIKRRMISAGREVFLLVDSSKFGVVSLVSIASFAEIDYLVTDRAPGPEYMEILSRNDVKVLVP